MGSTGRAAKGHRRNILIIVENLPVPFDRRVWQIATTLVAHGYELSIICPVAGEYTKRYEVLEGIHIYRHPLPIEGRGLFGYLLEYTAALFWQLVLSVRVFVNRRFDAIHICNPPDTMFLVAAPFKFLFGVKIVFDHHDLNPELYVAKFAKKDVFYRLLKTLERWTFRLADLTIATNESYKQVAIERGGKDPGDVFVVRSGPSLERIQIAPPESALKNGRAYLVGYVGVMGKQEGIEYLLKAAHHIVYELGRHDIQFGLVGAGPEFEHVKQLAEELCLSKYVTFTGRLPDKEMLSMLNTSDVCVNPDEVNEMNDKSTMNKIMEYMALGKPIVQFDMTEGRFSAQEASLYAKANDSIDLGSKILELLDDPARRRVMGEFGRQRVERELAWGHEVPRLLAAYEKLMS